MEPDDFPGKLTLVATPIGNMGDLSPRAAQALSAADFWIVEDSRVSAKLSAHLEVRKSMKVLNDHSHEGQVQGILKSLHGANACLVTDGGCPVVSDPGSCLLYTSDAADE